MDSSIAAPVSPADVVVARWISAFNRRGLAEMLACLDRAVEFHPLKLHEIEPVYHGHAGVERWFEHLDRYRHDHRIVVSSIQVMPSGKVLTSGGLTFGSEPVATPFCAVHTVTAALIVAAHHYMSDAETVIRLGLV